MSGSNAFSTAFETLDWARQAIEEMDDECKAFFRGNIFRAYTDVDHAKQLYVRKLQIIQDLPGSVSRKATEAIQNIKNAFDQSLYAAIKALGREPPRNLYFPWSTSPENLERRFVDLGITLELRPLIRTFEPYGRSESYAGGDSMVRALAQLANRKHSVRLSFTPRVSGFETVFWAGVIPAGSIARTVKPKFNPKTREVTLAIWSFDVESGPRTKIDFQVAFAEPGFVDGYPIVEALMHFLSKATAVAEQLEQGSKRINEAQRAEE